MVLAVRVTLSHGGGMTSPVNDSGDVLLQKAEAQRSMAPKKKAGQSIPKDRFEKVRGRADIEWRTQDLMSLLRGES